MSDYDDDGLNEKELARYEQKIREGAKRKLRGRIWQFFIAYGRYHGQCKYCRSVLSCRSSTGNLKTHLRKRHPRVFANFDHEKPPGEQKIGTHLNSKTANKVSKATDAGSSKFSSAIWRQFSEEDDVVRCSHCGVSAEAGIEALKTHLEEHHTELMDQIIADAQKGMESDSEQNVDENDLYTEVVYLEDDVPPPLAKAPRLSVTVPPKITQENSPDETELFINYLRCLLKKVPKEAAGKLQLDIINLIVNANANATQNVNHSQNVVIDNQLNSATHFQDGVASGVKVIALPIERLMPRQEKMYISVPSLCVSKTDNISTATSTQNNVPNGEH